MSLFDGLPELLSSRPWVGLPLVFAGGVLTSFTPCIYPMIPITAAIVGGQAIDGVQGRNPAAVKLTFAYVTGVALSYALLGLLAGLTGSIFGGISTNPWSQLIQANLLLYFALVLLDVVPLPIPRRWIERAARQEARGRMGSAFVMGTGSGLVAAPCGAPVMATVLTWVAATHSAVLGFVYLFVFSLGMCTLLVVVGFTAGGASRLPRGGAWMLRVKQFFAIVLIAMSEYYLIQMGKVLL